MTTAQTLMMQLGAVLVVTSAIWWWFYQEHKLVRSPLQQLARRYVGQVYGGGLNPPAARLVVEGKSARLSVTRSGRYPYPSSYVEMGYKAPHNGSGDTDTPPDFCLMVPTDTLAFKREQARVKSGKQTAYTTSDLPFDRLFFMWGDPAVFAPLEDADLRRRMMDVAELRNRHGKTTGQLSIHRKDGVLTIRRAGHLKGPKAWQELLDLAAELSRATGW